MSDFIMTLDSDDEEDVVMQQPQKSAASTSAVPKKSKAPAEVEEKDDLNPEFDFDFGGNVNGNDAQWGNDLVESLQKGKAAAINVDDIIERRKDDLKKKEAASGTKKRKRDIEDLVAEDDDEEWGGIDSGNEEDASEDDEDAFGKDVQVVDDYAEDGESDSEEVDPLAGDSEDEDEFDDAASDISSTASVKETAAQIERKRAFFSAEGEASTSASTSLPTSFNTMNLSRPLLRNITTLNFAQPTPIQARSIPLALLGRDILGSAQTGSGKTAAFMIPVLERMLYREKGKGGKGAASRVLVLCPTRELAVQCEAVGKALSAGMDVRFALLVGGLSLNAQSSLLRTLPDILIATPGRLIDHIRNSPSFTLDALDILIVDEADRMLEAGFSDELNEIIRSCPRSRQTMLFSATMTDSVDELVRLSLNKPVRLFVDSAKKTAKNLVQEFVRVREKKENDGVRAALLLSLCKRTVKDKCIIFFRSKALAHQMRILFGLMDLKAGELHGNLTQEQRLQALQEFKEGKCQYLLATDLASRGLDIKGVETVINFDMPGQLAAYVHRVGRTARAGRSGRSITLVGEADRKMLKAAVKASPSDKVRHRVVPPEVVSAMVERLDELKGEVEEVLKEEKEEKAYRTADMEIRKGENMIEHRDEIYARPARTWFQTEKEKKASAEISKAGYVSAFDKKEKKSEIEEPKPKRDKFSGMTRIQKRRKMAAEADEEENRSGAVAAAIRAAKKGGRPRPIDQPEPAKQGKGGKKGGGSPKKAAQKIKIGKGNFDTSFGKKHDREGARAGRRDGVGMGGKAKGKATSKTKPKGGSNKKRR